MASILLIGPDPETREILKLRLEVEGFGVLTALGQEDAALLIERKRPAAVIVDMIDYDEDEQKEVLEIIKKTGQMKVSSVLLLPRGNLAITAPAAKLCDFCRPSATHTAPKTDLVIKKPYDLNALVAQIKKLISSPKKSCSSRRGSHRRS